MKYISVLVFVLLMVVTWSLSQTGSTADLQQHKQVEASFEDYVRASIQKQMPNVKDVVFRQLYTETIRPNEELKAFFRYDVVAPTTAGDTTAQTVEGYVTLKSSDQGQNWTMSGEHVSTPTLRFQDGVKISTKDTDNEESAPVSASTEEPPAAATPAAHEHQ